MKIIEEPQLEIKSKLPRFVDVLLYPASLHGISYIAIFLFLSILINLIDKFVFSYAYYYGGVFSAILSILLFGYIIYYFGYCIFDSSKGNKRAPDISIAHTPNQRDLISQILYLLGAFAICFWPTAVYYIFTEQRDLRFWVLWGCGMFFLPVSLLRVVLFDAIDALNPIMIIGSILKTFLPYCGLVLSFCVFGGFAAAVFWLLKCLPVLHFFSNVAGFYLAFVAAHLLGRFYWQNKDKLDWGI